jgi:Lar family restriction alleviation protein
MNVELKPCPFCGKEPNFTSATDLKDNFDHGFTIWCGECGIKMEDEYRGDVAGRWNRRFLFDSLEDEKQRIIAEAERLLQTVEQFEVTEPYGYVFQHEETGLKQVVEVQQVEWGFEKNNPRWQRIGPVYLRPQSAAVRDETTAPVHKVALSRNQAAALSDYVTKKYGNQFEPDDWLAYWTDISSFILGQVEAFPPEGSE